MKFIQSPDQIEPTDDFIQSLWITDHTKLDYEEKNNLLQNGLSIFDFNPQPNPNIQYSLDLPFKEISYSAVNSEGHVFDGYVISHFLQVEDNVRPLSFEVRDIYSTALDFYTTTLDYNVDFTPFAVTILTPFGDYREVFEYYTYSTEGYSFPLLGEKRLVNFRLRKNSLAEELRVLNYNPANWNQFLRFYSPSGAQPPEGASIKDFGVSKPDRLREILLTDFDYSQPLDFRLLYMVEEETNHFTFNDTRNFSFVRDGESFEFTLTTNNVISVESIND